MRRPPSRPPPETLSGLRDRHKHPRTHRPQMRTMPTPIPKQSRRRTPRSSPSSQPAAMHRLREEHQPPRPQVQEMRTMPSRPDRRTSAAQLSNRQAGRSTNRDPRRPEGKHWARNRPGSGWHRPAMRRLRSGHIPPRTPSQDMRAMLHRTEQSPSPEKIPQKTAAAAGETPEALPGLRSRHNHPPRQRPKMHPMRRGPPPAHRPQITTQEEPETAPAPLPGLRDRHKPQTHQRPKMYPMLRRPRSSKAQPPRTGPQKEGSARRSRTAPNNRSSSTTTTADQKQPDAGNPKPPTALPDLTKQNRLTKMVSTNRRRSEA